MDIQFRPATAEEMGQFGMLAGYVYGGAYGDGPDNLVASATRPEWTLCAFDGSRLVSSFSTVPFTMRANGVALPIGGISAVGTLPEYRRQGLVRRIMTRAFADMRDGGRPVAALWASQAAIYQRYGFAMASALRSYAVDTVDIDFHDGDDGSRRVERLDVASGYELIKDVYVHFVADRMGYLHRAQPLWLHNAFEEREADGPVHIALSHGASGPDGYAVYTLREGRRDHPTRTQEIGVRDLAWLSPDAYRSLWMYFKRHDLVGRVRWNSAPSDDPAIEYFLEPRLLEARDNEGFWLRLVDVAAALAGRGWTTDGEISITVREDSLAPWNTGSYRLTVSGGTADVAPCPTGTDIEISVKALASLYTGRRSARELSAWGLLNGNANAVQRADNLFATQHAPHCPDHF
ncbi:MAG: GNAT family N-acetyltransferase [Gammaproteobacteria bacterium]|nr:GNAT family N-acetyltransferase [Gammaproteobacteria bacterium]